MLAPLAPFLLGVLLTPASADGPTCNTGSCSAPTTLEGAVTEESVTFDEAAPAGVTAPGGTGPGGPTTTPPARYHRGRNGGFQARGVPGPGGGAMAAQGGGSSGGGADDEGGGGGCGRGGGGGGGGQAAEDCSSCSPSSSLARCERCRGRTGGSTASAGDIVIGGPGLWLATVAGARRLRRRRRRT